ncbi:3-methyladenine DNA glycosylase [Lysinibacter sp. HNR]|uniref:3-methyladenine DNA glycosylase n=1 Tax=Lysinibacter sp. HNR TaxID=3031408 RepID=UPI0024348F2B|nr:3-methyladenine DNA glycosylase [Lysinibacter sp. HNR]WGD37701.1 3-methyladenine DNA glycosylase [Lysinibacter sp. HNR]
MKNTPLTAESQALSHGDWTQREVLHQRRADNLTAGWRQRQQTGERHAIEDFLFTYYPFKPSLLRRWHPGAGVELERASREERARWRWYTGRGESLVVDAAAFIARKSASLNFIERLMRSTAARPAQFSCFGLHEWAMVYRLTADTVRHANTPLRLSPQETDRVVESHKIACSHYDAFRFFTAPAVGLNTLRPTRENQPAIEQPGCLHAGMDVYKWVIKLGPLIPGELLLDSFELARDIRVLDMRASPYDVSGYGLTPVAIETDEGKAEYVRQQREFSALSQQLRERVVTAITQARIIASQTEVAA